MSNELKPAIVRFTPDSTSVRAPVGGYANWRGCSIFASPDRVPELAVLDPATGEAIGHIPAGGVPEAHHAVAGRRAAHGAWARTAPEARGSLLKAAARRLREHARELAELQTLEAGTPLADSLGGSRRDRALEAYAELGPLDRGRCRAGTWCCASRAASWRS